MWWNNEEGFEHDMLTTVGYLLISLTRYAAYEEQTTTAPTSHCPP